MKGIGMKNYIFISFLFLFSTYNWPKEIAEAEYNSTIYEKAIVIVVPSYNNKDWYQRNLTSILQQEYRNFRVIYIDDCSPDGTAQLVEEFLKEHDHDHRVTLIKNKERRGALCNHWMAIQMIPDHVIVVHCDGDDWFGDCFNNPNPYVLQRINLEYQDPDVWLTYGQYVCFPSGEIGPRKPLIPEVVANNMWRYASLGLKYSNPRTFYAWLFKLIALDDLLIDGRFFPTAGDNAFMYPMLEMAQYHVRFIPDVLYVYNQETPLNDYKLRLKLQFTIARYIQKKPPYKPLKSAPVFK
jgi:glycosyltransferase involved in cell wall biosynthesis